MKSIDLLIGTGGGERVFFKLNEDVLDDKLKSVDYSIRVGERGSWTKLPFAMYLDEADSENLTSDFKSYVSGRKSGIDPRGKSECLRELREKYIGSMPEISGGIVVYLDKTDSGYVLRKSKMASSLEVYLDRHDSNQTSSTH
jgi:hypothetical protein